MIIVIIAGGSGTRLWPLSTPAYPKHLLKINGDDQSLLQQTYQRAKQLTNDIYIVSEVSHITHVKKQIPSLPEHAFIVEPGRRGTANCIISSLVQIAKRHGPDEPVAFIAADHYIRDTKGFVHSFRVATEKSVKENKLTLIGVEPIYAATGFGYIQKGNIVDEESLVYAVRSFKEKPSYEVAKNYFRSGEYLWNCSYFVGSTNTFLDIMKTHAPELFANHNKLQTAKQKDYEQLYLSFVSDSIDYALIEKLDDLLVVPASFDWMDLGSFKDLHRALGGDKLGNVMHGHNIEIEEVENSLIHNQENKPVAVIGLDNVVIVNTADGILVARKDNSQLVGEVSKRFTNKS